jgi:hypothetical protein
MERDCLFDLQTLANVAEIFGVLTVVGGVLFGLVQLREFRRQRRDAVAADLMRSFHSPDLARAVSMICQLPEGVSAKELRARGPEYETAAITICTTFETMGLLVYREIAPFEIVRELAGGILVVTWKRLETWAAEVRVEQSQPSFTEWFHWLAERIEEWNETHDCTPAYERHVDWKPRL